MESLQEEVEVLEVVELLGLVVLMFQELLVLEVQLLVEELPGGGTPGSGGGGPTTPGTGSGGGPTPGGGVPNPPTVCICRVTEIQERPEVSFSDGSFGKTIFFIQTCEKVPVTEVDQNTATQSIDNYLKSFTNSGNTIVNKRQYGNPDKDCKDPATGECGGACDILTVFIRYFKPVTTPQPPDIIEDTGTGVIDYGLEWISP
jgi:hypothetical protein